MYEHIMVPLDGSPLSEVALTHAQTLAQKLGAKLLLLRVATSRPRSWRRRARTRASWRPT